jgi:hypothetical protein
MKNIAPTMLIFVIGSCSAQDVENPPAKFPSDNQNRHQAGVFKLLQAACLGYATDGEEMGCDNPDSQGKLLVYSLLRGHFLSASSEDAILWTGGPNWKLGIPYLLTRKAGKWFLKDFNDESFPPASTDLSMCHKVRVPDGNDALICLSSYGSRYGMTDRVTFHDYKSERHADLYSVTDASQNCGLDPNPDHEQDPSKPVTVTREFISAVEFEKRAGQPDTISVTVSKGKVEMKPGCDNPVVIQITDSAHVRFPWTGKSY